jgi:MFS family permease
MTAFEPLRHAPFRRLLTARVATFLGNGVSPIALGFAVLDLTGSVAALGIVVAARSVANVALLLVGGVLADRLPRPVLLTGSELVAAGTQAGAAALVLTGRASVPWLVVLAAVNGAAAALSMPAAAALLPQTVPQRLLRQANALSRIGISSALILGAALGGLLVAAVGPGWGLAADAASFALAALCFAGLRVPPARRGPRGSMLGDLREGWSEVRSRTWVWIVILQFALVNAAFVGGLVVLGPAVADATFGRSGWGFALALQGVGFVAGGLLALRWQPERVLAWGVLVVLLMALPLVGLALAPTVLLVGAGLFLTGVAMEQFTVAWDVSLQEHLPADRLARVYSFDMFGSFLAVPVGEVAVGPVAERVGVGTTLLGCAGIVVAATALALASPAVRTLRRRPPEPLLAADAMPDRAVP